MPDFQAVFEHVPARLLVLDPDLVIVAVTDAYLAITMTRREDIVGRPLFEVFPDNPDDPAATGESNLRASLDRVRTRKVADTMAVQQYDIQRPADQGGGFEVRWWSPVNAPVLGERGELRYIVHRVEDVTEFVRNRESSDERSAALEAEILERANELQTTNQALREANATKSQFLSRVSHELRTPLNAVLGFAQLLDLDDLDPQQRDAVHHILRGGRHLLALINEVLDISRIEAGELTLSREPVLVAKAIDEATELMQALADDQGITLVVDPPDADAWVLADQQRLRQILLNLLSNAIKYNRPAGTVRVSTSLPLPGLRRISVHDTGLGIAPEQRSLVFLPFERLGAEQTHIEGTGIGLALSRNLAEALGGQLDFESVPGEGTTFHLDLYETTPIEESDLVPPALAPIGPSDHSRRTIVYIEDNLANVELMERALDRRGDVTLITAMQGRLGLELVEQHRPDVVLLDVHLPDMDGYDVLRHLRANEATAAVPVIVLSADATKEQIRRLEGAGAVAYLTKPLDLRELLDTIEAHVPHLP
jgi:signal transduction histidine kinase/CheY-like chemotaxis protein